MVVLYQRRPAALCEAADVRPDLLLYIVLVL